MQQLSAASRSEIYAASSPEVSVEPTPNSTDIEVAARQVTEALEQLVNARAGQVDAERRLREAREADDAMEQLTSLFRDEANIRVALGTTRELG
jgi:hypothetical protein